MKKTIKSLIFVIIANATISCTNIPKNVTLTPLSHFFVKNGIEKDSTTKTLVIDSKKEFDKYFGIAKTMNSTIPEIDFKNDVVLAIIGETTDSKTAITIISSKLVGDKVTVKYDITKGEKQSFSHTPLLLFSAPLRGKNIEFILNKN